MFELDLKSRKSIYEQVIDNLKEMIMTDELPFDSKLPSVRELSKQIFRLLDCKGVVRTDYMYDRVSGELYITEINTIPGSMAFYLWEKDGLPYSDLIDRLVEYAEKAHADKNINNYAYTSDILKSAVIGGKGAKGSKGSKAVKA